MRSIIHQFKEKKLWQLKMGHTPAGNERLHKIASIYVAIPICVFGLIGNIISIFVWKKINKKRSESGKSAGVYFIALAICDSGLLLFFLMTESFLQIDPTLQNNLHYIQFHSYVGFPFFFFFIVSSIWMVICVTMNRFIAVVYPHKAQDWNSLRMTYIIIAVTLCFSFCINIPHFFNFYPEFKHGNYSEAPTKYGASMAATYYDFWTHCMALVLIPWVTIFCLNIAIIRKLKYREKLQSNIKGESKRERQTTVILLVISISFLAFLIWQCVTQCFWMLKYGQNSKSGSVWFYVDSAYAFARLGVVFNSSINFVFYCLTGSMFRKEMFNMVYRWLGQDYQALESSSMQTSSSARPRSKEPAMLVNSSGEDLLAKSDTEPA